MELRYKEKNTTNAASLTSSRGVITQEREETPTSMHPSPVFWRTGGGLLYLLFQAGGQSGGQVLQNWTPCGTPVVRLLVPPTPAYSIVYAAPPSPGSISMLCVILSSPRSSFYTIRVSGTQKAAFLCFPSSFNTSFLYKFLLPRFSPFLRHNTTRNRLKTCLCFLSSRCLADITLQGSHSPSRHL